MRDDAPIFIHSLFRAGSTYLFNVFRCSDRGYWCYQEPLHEVAFFCRENPSGLQEGHGEAKAQLLRHPQIDGSYFRELLETWPAWKDAINEQIIYNAYFSDGEDIGIAYWRTLADAARGRPVFQECRTAGRIRTIKVQMGGRHIYLWRNPWDQWWSYKVTPYFDVTSQLTLRASHPPQPVQHMLAALHLPVYEGKDLAEAFAFYGERPLTSEQSYLAFYLLWCLALREGIRYADLLINIDRLSDSLEYQTEVRNRLERSGIEGLDFSNCRVPQGRYLEREYAFFHALEGQVHQWLLSGGWSQSDIDEIQTLRRENQPGLWSTLNPNLAIADLTEQASRARELARRFETTQAERARNDARRIGEVEVKAQLAEARATQAEARESAIRTQLQRSLEMAQQAQNLATQTETHSIELETALTATREELNAVHQANHHHWQQLEAVRKELHDVHQANHHHYQLAEARQQQIQELINNTPWRITLQLRLLAVAVRHMTPNLLKQQIKVLLQHAAIFIRRRPWLKRAAIAILNHFPGLKSRLVYVATGTMVIAQPPGVSADLAHLTPRARQIHADLKTSIEQRQKEIR